MKKLSNILKKSGIPKWARPLMPIFLSAGIMTNFNLGALAVGTDFNPGKDLRDQGSPVEQLMLDPGGDFESNILNSAYPKIKNSNLDLYPTAPPDVLPSVTNPTAEELLKLGETVEGAMNVVDGLIPGSLLTTDALKLNPETTLETALPAIPDINSGSSVEVPLVNPQGLSQETQDPFNPGQVNPGLAFQENQNYQSIKINQPIIPFSTPIAPPLNIDGVEFSDQGTGYDGIIAQLERQRELQPAQFTPTPGYGLGISNYEPERFTWDNGSIETAYGIFKYSDSYKKIPESSSYTLLKDGSVDKAVKALNMDNKATAIEFQALMIEVLKLNGVTSQMIEESNVKSFIPAHELNIVEGELQITTEDINNLTFYLSLFHYPVSKTSGLISYYPDLEKTVQFLSNFKAEEIAFNPNQNKKNNIDLGVIKAEVKKLINWKTGLASLLVGSMILLSPLKSIKKRPKRKIKFYPEYRSASRGRIRNLPFSDFRPQSNTHGPTTQILDPKIELFIESDFSNSPSRLSKYQIKSYQLEIKSKLDSTKERSFDRKKIKKEIKARIETLKTIIRVTSASESFLDIDISDTVFIKNWLAYIRLTKYNSTIGLKGRDDYEDFMILMRFFKGNYKDSKHSSLVGKMLYTASVFQEEL